MLFIDINRDKTWQTKYLSDGTFDYHFKIERGLEFRLYKEANKRKARQWDLFITGTSFVVVIERDTEIEALERAEKMVYDITHQIV